MKKQEPPKPLQGYQWIVHDPDLLGGKPALKDTRISVSMILECFAQGMTAEEIADDYPGFPKECIPEVLKFAARQMDKPLAA